MPFCVAVGCSNQTENNKNVSFHTMLKDRGLFKAWEAVIGRTNLPQTGRLCSDHFEPRCYEESSMLKMELCSDLFQNRKSTRRRLKKSAIPTLFAHKEGQLKTCQRTTSIVRANRAEQCRVRFL